MSKFIQEYPSLESYFRSVVLIGKNSASYKFSLAKTLMELAQQEATFISREDLAISYAQHICEHIKSNDKQGTSNSSKFLKACRDYNSSKICFDELIKVAKVEGLDTVLGKFHNVNHAELPVKFYEEAKEGRKKGIILTDDLFRLKESIQHNNFKFEIEARWRLVETSWALNISQNLLSIEFDNEKKLFYVKDLEIRQNRRIDVTSSRDALNSYQKGKCFYCFDDISLDSNDDNFTDVDHFMPHSLQKYTSRDLNLDGVWNLVLACKSCNRGKEEIGGKFARVPVARYLERLNNRNEFFIESHHPLTETLELQTGKQAEQRIRFLQQRYKFAIENLISTWEAPYEYEPAF